MGIQSLNTELEPLIPFKGGGTWRLMYKMLYHISLLKYVRQNQIHLIDKLYSKICGKKKIQNLCELGYLKNTQDDIFIATNKTHALLDQEGYDRSLLPSVSGKGSINEIKNTEAFIKLMKEPDFFTFLFPRFPKNNSYLIPDALMVLKRDNEYKLQFLEIEASKFDWENYILIKRDNYRRLAQEDLAYFYWHSVAQKLGFRIPKKSEFFFSVVVVGEYQPDWKEDGFAFRGL